MAASYKILGQANLTTTSDTDIYTVPSSTEVIVSTLIVANIESAATTFNLAIRDGGEGVDVGGCGCDYGGGWYCECVEF